MGITLVTIVFNLARAPFLARYKRRISNTNHQVVNIVENARFYLASVKKDIMNSEGISSDEEFDKLPNSKKESYNVLVDFLNKANSRGLELF